MNLRSVGRFPLGLLISLSLLPSGFGQVATRMYLTSTQLSQQQIEYLGVYEADGKYQPVSKWTPWYNRESQTATRSTRRPEEVPTFVDLHSRERVVENLQPPLHAGKSSSGKSFWAGVRDQVVRFAYGREQLLLSPHHVITDSTGRVIISDPAAAAVHVLDGEKSFRINSGPNRRMHSVNGIAVDAEDNIYVSDAEQGVVVVYDRRGNFLRNIGKLSNHETLFHYPTGIAIDRRTQQLYVLDSERHLLFMLDLQGKEIKRIGRYNGNDTVVAFEFPTEIAVGPTELAIMDAAGSRVWVTDLDGTPRTNFRFPTHLRRGIVDELGLAIDTGDHIYISNGMSNAIEIYDSSGKPLRTFDRVERQHDDFQMATGLCIDGQNHLYVADESTRHVQVFRLGNVAPVMMAAEE